MGTRFDEMLGILDTSEMDEAEVLGRAMRFGAMFSAETPLSHGELRWFPKKKHLELRLAEDAHDLFGAVAQARFAALVDALGATSEVRKLRGDGAG